jgi:hypothetical protein
MGKLVAAQLAIMMMDKLLYAKHVLQTAVLAL